MSNFAKQVLGICKRVNAEKITLEVEFDKASWWQRRRFDDQSRWHVTLEWEYAEEKFRASGIAVGLDDALDQAERQINGILLRNALTKDQS